MQSPSGTIEAGHRSRSPSAARWRITDHAVRRYRERVRWRDTSNELARGQLLAICQRAHRVKDIGGGLELWRGPKPLRLRLRVRPGEPMELVTVLEDCDGRRGKMPHGKANQRQQGIQRRHEEGQLRREGRRQ